MTTRVMFLKMNKGKFKDEITALLVDEKYYGPEFDDKHYMVYDHIGQHNGANIDWLKKNMSVAGIQEYLPLYTELKSIGEEYTDIEIVYQFPN